MSFVQTPPKLNHPLAADYALTCLLKSLPHEQHEPLISDLEGLGYYALEAWDRKLREPPSVPIHTPWDAWGKRVDRIWLTPAWQQGAAITTHYRLLRSGHNAKLGDNKRLLQFLRIYVYHLASEFYTCPLAMTDGAITVIKASDNVFLKQRALPHFLAQEESQLWLAGQWMTETVGGSDVSMSATQARRDTQGQWRLYGRKWFSSAIIGKAALALARPEGHDDLALFYVESQDENGQWQGLRIDRIKDKLGTRELPTAEIHLDGTPAWPVDGLTHGVRHITPVLTITRTWNAVCAVASMARALQLAQEYALKRTVFGKLLQQQALHVRTLADMQAEFMAAFALTFTLTKLLGKVETGTASMDETALWRIATPLAKLWTGKLAVRISSEALECFGGNGYIEDTHLPQILRDAQVYPIWEGTTNVLALDVLRSLSKTGIEPIYHALDHLLTQHENTFDMTPIRSVLKTLITRFEKIAAANELEVYARQLAFTLARIMAATMMAKSIHTEQTKSVQQSALRLFIAHGLSCLDAPLTDADTSMQALARASLA